MLSDEERKALEFFEKSFKKKIPPYWYDDTISNVEERIKVILNLIEKQSKEIEDYIENKELINQTLGLEKDSDINKTLEKIIILNNYENKIKAKIEYYEKIDKPVGKRVLQSLLEKE